MGHWWWPLGEKDVRSFSIRSKGLHKVSEVIGDLMFPFADGLRIDLSSVTFVRPAFLALLCANLEMRLKGNAGRSILPAQRIEIAQPRAKNVQLYLKRMNLVGALTFNSLDAIRTEPDDRFQPLCRITSSTEIEMVAGKIADIIKEALPSDVHGSVAMAVQVAIAELLENFRCHAEAESSGFVCAQYYQEHEYQDAIKKRRFRAGSIELAIADTGIGIETSLRQASEHKLALDAGENPCERATTQGVTSKPGKHSGLGLWLARRLAEQNKGSFFLVSDSRFLRVRNGTTKGGWLPGSLPRSSDGRRPPLVKWPGTFVGLKLRLDNRIDLNSLYSELSPLE